MTKEQCLNQIIVYKEMVEMLGMQNVEEPHSDFGRNQYKIYEQNVARLGALRKLLIELELEELKND